jgi:dTDP-4-dehydrorhamnose 3,5-epimerase
MTTMVFKFRPLSKLRDVILIEPSTFNDERGWFREEYKRSDFANHGIDCDFAQDNRSYTRSRGTIRGLHFQKAPEAQGKLVSCFAGEVFDVSVDIRKGSPAYASWEAVILSAENHNALWVPPGFAHGFQTLANDTVVAYKVTAEYSKANERCIRWNDPGLKIEWPIKNPILSVKDAQAPTLSEVDNNFEWQRAKSQDAT